MENKIWSSMVFYLIAVVSASILIWIDSTIGLIGTVMGASLGGFFLGMSTEKKNAEK